MFSAQEQSRGRSWSTRQSDKSSQVEKVRAKEVLPRAWAAEEKEVAAPCRLEQPARCLLGATALREAPAWHPEQPGSDGAAIALAEWWLKLRHGANLSSSAQPPARALVYSDPKLLGFFLNFFF